MAEAIKYVVVCACERPRRRLVKQPDAAVVDLVEVAFINDDRPIGGYVTVTAARPGEKQIIAAKGYNPQVEDWRVPDGWVASKYPQCMVTEVMWTSTDERESAIGWTVRCRNCGQQAQMKQTKLCAAVDGLAARPAKDKASVPCPAIDDSSVTEIREIVRLAELIVMAQ